MKLDVALFICENNSYSTHTHLRERVINPKAYSKVIPFDIKCSYVNHQNPEKLYVKLDKIHNCSIKISISHTDTHAISFALLVLNK